MTGAGSLIGAIFGYVILPVWVFYLLKDRVSLVASFDRGPAGDLALRHVGGHAHRRARLRPVGPRRSSSSASTVGVFTFIGLLILSRFVDPIFGRYAILLSVIAGILELLPIIGPIISAVPAVLLAATAGPESVIAALILYTLVQQVENNVLVPKIQGDADRAASRPRSCSRSSSAARSAGLLGAILALPVAAAGRDVVRYLFRRVGPDDDPASLADIVRGVGMADPVAQRQRPRGPGRPPARRPAVGTADA